MHRVNQETFGHLTNDVVLTLIGYMVDVHVTESLSHAILESTSPVVADRSTDGNVLLRDFCLLRRQPRWIYCI